jgi:hypothetical protein
MSTKKEVKRWLSDRSKCDICGIDITKMPFVDGKTIMGPWGLLCESCHETHGVGLGTGKGQSYNAKGIKTGG